MLDQFPPDFVLGVATSSYQIEGAFNVDGRTASIWDIFSKTPGKVLNGDTGDQACDHYNRYEEDIEHLKKLGVQAYRFSIAWPRLFPFDNRKREERGFNFYNCLIDALLAAGIEPMITLYHWDLPQYLEDKGGWAIRQTAIEFAAFAEECAKEFGDRVTNWITLNEPWCIALLGYYSGVHAPGKKSARDAIAASHHTALAHGLATREIRRICPDSKIGITVNMTNYHLESQDSELLKIHDLIDGVQNRWWIDAFLHGKYPENLVQEYGENLSRVFLPGDEKLIKVDNDFLGVNYYMDGYLGEATPESKKLSENSPYPLEHRVNQILPNEFFSSVTDLGWPVTPEGLGNLLERIHRDWPQISSIVVTENGAAYNDEPDSLGEVKDQRRVSYLKAHLESLNVARLKGVPVTGYFAWSLLDNFEWAEGYAQRFGMIFVDFQTQTRIPKESYYTYADIIEKNRAR